MEEAEKERMERERKAFERERGNGWKLWRGRGKKKKKKKKEEGRICAAREDMNFSYDGKENVGDEDDDWEYKEEGPAEIIWQENEIIVRKKKVRVPKKIADRQGTKEDVDRPTSNPLPPQSEAFTEYQNASIVSAQQMLENVAQQVPNFGTEQDKAHCPFHLKTGACRFGQRCSRVHFYPDKACTLLIKNNFGFISCQKCVYTDEEVECSYEEFYEDVHTEFLKYGEIVNFKVCKNGSFHLRGNVYVHYKSLDSAILAYHSINGPLLCRQTGMIVCVDLDLETWIVQSIVLIKVVTLKMIFQKSLTGEAIQKMMDLILMGVSQIEIQKEKGIETEKDIGIIIMQGKGHNTIAKCQNAQLIMENNSRSHEIDQNELSDDGRNRHKHFGSTKSSGRRTFIDDDKDSKDEAHRMHGYRWDREH
ncbi:hypothetical protein NC651_012029 [Populus alba x Populus x berolinensis]|nr:hypothetical protein NC651_012029 [Populus alba x Populus x berolinensis]